MGTCESPLTGARGSDEPHSRPRHAVGPHECTASGPAICSLPSNPWTVLTTATGASLRDAASGPHVNALSPACEEVASPTAVPDVFLGSVNSPPVVVGLSSLTAAYDCDWTPTLHH